MKIKENKAYRLIWLEDDCQLIIIKSNGLVRIYKRYEDEKGIFHDSLWLEDAYNELNIIMKSGSLSDRKFCYVGLTDECGSHSIIEVVNKEPILNEYQPNHYKIVYKKITPVRFCTPEITCVVYRVLNKRKKTYALYSLTEGFIFGPYNYEKIETLRNGVILDNKIAVENCGTQIDLINYEYDGGGVYISKDKKKYLLFLDQKDNMFVPMTKDDYDDNIMIAETDYEIFKYNKTTGECRCEPIQNNYHEADWSQYADIVYEGHSKLELGLED